MKEKGIILSGSTKLTVEVQSKGLALPVRRSFSEGGSQPKGLALSSSALSSLPKGLSKGFTLIELLVAIAIMAVLMAIALPNFLGARERARDAKKKGEMNQFKTALRMYYNDFQKYPASSQACSGGSFQILGCGDGGASCCPCDTKFDFAAGASCTAIYMKKYISVLSGMAYFVSADGETFCARIALENKSDPDLASNQSLCASACSSATHQFASCPSDNYCVCSD